MSSPTQHSFPSSPVSSQDSPQRLSSLYQYHNAPEVAPAAGLEYDDSIRPWSDKYPVVNTSPYPRWTPGSSTAPKEPEPISPKPPLIIFGMKLRTFIVVFAIVVCVIIGASVGGALGRPKAATAVASEGATTTLNPLGTVAVSTSSASTTASPTTSTYSAPVPTYSVLNDCPQSNNTIVAASVGSTSAQPKFTKHCDVASPLSASGARTLSQAFVYSFNDCINVCASINYWDGNTTCTVAAFLSANSRPANCFVGSADSGNGASALSALEGTSVALLNA